MTKNFVNFHVLISHSPSCLNRDDMNMQKTAIFGGKRRVRISSQSLKRTLRTSDYYRQHLGERSVRTLRLSDLRDRFVAQLAGRYDAARVEQVLNLLSDKKFDTPKVEGDAVMPWAIEEVAWYCEQVQQLEQAGGDVNAKELKKNSAGLHQAIGCALDIALSGRMATAGLMSELGKVDGALAVAHAITTHEVGESDLDWFTAVDDLQERGSGHLNTQEFSAGVFYRYASLNLAQLQTNLGNVPRDRALEIAAHVLHMLATEVPGAKQLSFAANNPADLALVSLSDLPVSLANAFEAPVRQRENGGYLSPSVDALHDYWANIHAGYGLDERCAEFLLRRDAATPTGLARRDSLRALEQWLVRDGKD
ncbi:MAG: type I-E CRISPR-associated protein Cas7/Cse4/CasC [Rhodocyclaceae bacterium]